MASAIRGGAHAVEDEPVIAFAVELGRIEVVLSGIDADVRRLAAVKLGKQRLEPVRVFVIDGNGLLWHTFLRFFEGRSDCEQPKMKKAAQSERPEMFD